VLFAILLLSDDVSAISAAEGSSVVAKFYEDTNRQVASIIAISYLARYMWVFYTWQVPTSELQSLMERIQYLELKLSETAETKGASRPKSACRPKTAKLRKGKFKRQIPGTNMYKHSRSSSPPVTTATTTTTEPLFVKSPNSYDRERFEDETDTQANQQTYFEKGEELCRPVGMIAEPQQKLTRPVQLTSRYVLLAIAYLHISSTDR
jgi:hypothetical protein